MHRKIREQSSTFNTRSGPINSQFHGPLVTMRCVIVRQREALGRWDASPSHILRSWSNSRPGRGSPLRTCAVPFFKISVQVVDAPVSTVDIGATFFEMAGISKPADMDTVSLVPALVNGTITQECVTTGYATWRAALKKFNSSTTLKFVCCMPPGCPNPPSNIPDHKKSSNMQLLMYNTTAGASGSYDMAELGCGGHQAQLCPPEALEMAQQLPTSGYDGSWAENCSNALLYQ